MGFFIYMDVIFIRLSWVQDTVPTDRIVAQVEDCSRSNHPVQFDSVSHIKLMLRTKRTTELQWNLWTLMHLTMKWLMGKG